MKTIWLLLSGIIILSASPTPFFIPTKDTAHVFEQILSSQDLPTQETLSKSPDGLISLMVMGVFLVIYNYISHRRWLFPYQPKHFLLAVFYQSNNFKKHSFSS